MTQNFSALSWIRLTSRHSRPQSASKQAPVPVGCLSVAADIGPGIRGRNLRPTYLVRHLALRGHRADAALILSETLAQR